MKTVVRFALTTLIALVMSIPAVPQQSAAKSNFLPATQDRDHDRDRDRNERHPHIRAAIRELEQAKHELQTANHDFGGHRADALKACDEAIRQLQQALQYDKK